MKTIIKIVLVLLLTSTFAISQNAEAIFNRGLENYRAKKYEPCVSDFKAYIAIQPTIPQAHYNLGLCYSALSNHPDAVSAFTEATRLKPDYYDAFVFLGNELDTSGNYPAAVIAYNNAVKIDPNKYWAHLELGVAHNNSAKYPLAMASYKTALRLDPDNTSAIYGIGLVNYNLRNKLELKKQIDVLRPLDAAKADQLQAKLDLLGPKPPTLVKKPIVKTAQRIKDEKDVAAMQDFGFDAAMVIGIGSIRETPAKTGKLLIAVKRGDVLSLVDRTESNGFYKVVEEKSGTEGWIDENSIVVKLTGNTENGGPPINDVGAGVSNSANPEVSITNGEAKTTLKIRLNGTLYLIAPKTTKVISVSAGKFTYYGWSPVIRPTSGKATLEKGRKYSWSFVINRR